MDKRDRYELKVDIFGRPTIFDSWQEPNQDMVDDFNVMLKWYNESFPRDAKDFSYEMGIEINKKFIEKAHELVKKYNEKYRSIL